MGTRHIWLVGARDTLLALLVLAVAFLNFGAASATLAAPGSPTAAATSYCGDPLMPADGGHFACHACRPDVAVLPPAPAEPKRACFATAVAFMAVVAATPAPAAFAWAAPRGPPAA